MALVELAGAKASGLSAWATVMLRDGADLGLADVVAADHQNVRLDFLRGGRAADCKQQACADDKDKGVGPINLLCPKDCISVTWPSRFEELDPMS
jgi:hypothetical protein